MDNARLNHANEMLSQQGNKKHRRLILIIIGIIVSIIVIIILLAAYLRARNAPPFYPYIPTPKRTLHSTTVAEMFTNILMDSGDVAVEYSVISRRDLSGGLN